MAHRYPQLDGLRAVAALTIFATHAALQLHIDVFAAVTARLNLGVAIFFVLSGFLLYRPWAAGKTVELRGYAIRRVVRIVPAYWAALLLLGVFQRHLVPGVFGDRWWAYFGFLQVYNSGDILGGIGVAWSLATELAFYVVLPFYALAAQKLPRRVELGVLAASVVGAFALRAAVDHHGGIPTYDNTLLGSWPWFAAGLALAVISVERTTVSRTVQWVSAGAAAGAFVLAVIILPRNVFALTAGDRQWEMLLFGVIAAGLMVPALFGTVPALRHPVARWLGTVSYGIFLWHTPILSWVAEHVSARGAGLALGLALSIGIAALSWYALERPLLRYARTTTGAPSGTRRSSRWSAEP